jgi:hypothetical protein
MPGVGPGVGSWSRGCNVTHRIASNWLLHTGLWNDTGVWDDAATWID